MNLLVGLVLLLAWVGLWHVIGKRDPIEQLVEKIATTTGRAVRAFIERQSSRPNERL